MIREGEYQFVNPMPKVMQQVYLLNTNFNIQNQQSIFVFDWIPVTWKYVTATLCWTWRILQVDMRAMKEVNINWKMLTNLRPGNKPDEIFFAQWVISGRIFLGWKNHRLVNLERLKRATRREEEEARVSSKIPPSTVLTFKH